MSQDDSFADLMAQLRAGDDDAATRLFTRFGNRLIALARTRLDRQIRQKLDPEDVLQSVFRSFFGRFGDGAYDLNNWDSLWSLLVVLTLRKCWRKVEFFRSQRRDVREEVSAAPCGEADGCRDAVARSPTPAEAAMLGDLVEQLLRSLPEHERPILVLRLQGHTVAEISTQVDRPKRSIERILQHIRKRLQSLEAAQD